MKLIVSLGLLWVCLALGIGVAGAGWFERTWKSSCESSLRQSASQLALVVSAQVWTRPLEADPAWADLERRFGFDIVPTAQALGSADSVRWQRPAAGVYRITTNVRLLKSIGGMHWLQISRAVDPMAFTRMWWIGWTILNLLAATLFGLGVWMLRVDTKGCGEVLQTWLESSRRSPLNGRELLGTMNPPDSEQGVVMSMIAESVNQVYAALLSSNERSELVFGNLREGVLAVDDRSQILLANKALRSLLEIPDETYLHRPFLEVIRVPVVAKLVSDVLAEQEPRAAEVEYGKQASILHILARPLPIGEGRWGALITVRDETQIKRVDLIRRDFVANASHELKTPLAAIRAYAESLQLGALDDRETAEKFIANIISQADRINGLVQGMLQLSRVEAGVTLNFQPFDVMEALKPCFAAASVVAKSKGVELLVQASHETIVIQCDRDGFQTIASNLLSNAVRYTDAGGVVSVNCELHEQLFRLSVRDTGIGIKPEDLERVFERFYRAEKDRSSDTGGTGLGLSIVKHLVQALGGSVYATSQPGLGSTFVVELASFGK